MKKLTALIAAGLIILSMAGCSSKCKAAGCDEKPVKDGFCEEHYLEHQLEKLFGEF